MNSYNNILNEIVNYKEMIKSYTESDKKDHIMRRWRLKQNKKNIKNIKYQLFLTRISAPSFPNVTYINEYYIHNFILKEKMIFLKEEKEKILTFYRSRCTDYWECINNFNIQIQNLNNQLQELSTIC